MKLCLVLVLLAMVWATGCSTSSKPVGGGYYTRTFSYFSWEPGGLEESLRFRRKEGGTILVWENFTGYVLTKGDMAVFEGTTRPENENKLFVAKDGARRFEVGNAILAFEAAKENTNVAAFVAQHTIDTSSFKELSNGVEVQYWQRHGVNNPRLHISLTWNELSTIVQRVAVEGKLHQDKSGLSYLEISWE